MIEFVVLMVVAMVSITRDKSLIDEEDELLYGDDSMMVKKEEIKS